MTLRAYLLLLTLALLVPVITFATVVGYMLVERDRETFRRGAEERTLAMTTAVDARLASSISTLEALATLPALDQGDFATFRDRAVRVLATRPEWLSINLAMPAGQQVMNLARPGEGALPDNAAFDSQWRSVVERGVPAISDLITGPLTLEWHFAVRVPVRRNGSIKYVLSAAVKPASISDLLQRQNVPSDWVAVVLDKSGRIVARTFEADHSVGKVASQSLRDALAQSASGWFQGSTIEGSAVYTPYRRSGESGWTFAMGIPAAVVNAAAWRAAGLLVLGLLGSAAIAIVLARVIATRISRPLTALASATAAMRNGEAVDIKELATVAEIRTLETAFRVSIQELAERARLLDLAHDAIIVRDPNERIAYWNRGAEEIYGWHRDEVAWKIPHEVLRTEFPEPLASIMETLRRDGQWSGELVHYKRDGARIVVASRWALERGDGGISMRVLEINSDVTERKRAELALRETDRVKDQFLATLGHELRNPLAALVNSVHVLKHVEPGGATAIEALSVVERQTRQMTRLLGDLLDLTRITMGKLTLEHQPIDLTHVVAETIRTWKNKAESLQVGIAMRARGPIWVIGDRGRIEQVVSNLLDNALKFSSAGQQVSVDVRRDGTDAVLSVSDAGVGISAQAIDGSFKHFVQGEPGAKKGGLGIGLAVVKQLVEMHGGTVSAHSGGVGLGASFSVRLPAVEAEEVTSARPMPKPIGAQRILIVEDNADAREMLRYALALAGHVVREAEDGSSGVLAAKAMLPDIALIDLGLPDMDGYEVAQRIRISNLHIKLIALSGFGQEKDVQRALASGFDLHLTKPVEPEKLKQAFASLL